ncbi:hypothetical protein CMUST_15920 (plasmid) [Corynebacterium mustelae]|uniref:Uncharacterized protein n=1 Tax=Corynebacterium mustelae TaxID=571915 RepID=A0A0G3H8H6_9CORY|nr:hypothetical protein CMUST_04300 [Corynebacterium mustelae]AKK07472.1 hypothetical protein CMUST_15920 [Corynebacterium mustelae]
MLKLFKNLAIGFGSLSAIGIVIGILTFFAYPEEGISIITTMVTGLMSSGILWVLCEIADRLPEPSRIPPGMQRPQMPAGVHPANPAHQINQ